MSEVHMPTEFHRWITNLMEARKISINGLAGLAELDSPALNKALRGRRPVSANVAKKIAPFLGATAAEILLMAEAGKHLVTSPVDTYRAVVSEMIALWKFDADELRAAERESRRLLIPGAHLALACWNGRAGNETAEDLAFTASLGVPTVDVYPQIAKALRLTSAAS